MDTVFSDGSHTQPGMLARPVGACKRLLSGESLCNRSTSRRLAFAAPYPGKISPDADEAASFAKGRLPLSCQGGELGAFLEAVRPDFLAAKAFTHLIGPGRMWLQGRLWRLADRLIAAAPATGRQAEEGSVLGGVGRALRGDHR